MDKESDDRFGALLGAVDREKNRLARHLHDTVAQNLAALSMNLTIMGAARDDQKRQDILAECMSLAGECIAEVRAISYALHPPLLDELGIVSAVQSFSSSFVHDYGAELEIKAPPGKWACTIGRRREAELFRMIQDCCTSLADAGADFVTLEIAPGNPLIARVSGNATVAPHGGGLLGWILEARARSCTCRVQIHRTEEGSMFEFAAPAEGQE